MLTGLCKELNNWFETGRRFGSFTVTDGFLDGTGWLQYGQYYRIVGSTFNDGVHQYPSKDLYDETFSGAVWPMAVPLDVVQLSDDIDKWTERYATAEAMSPFQSESFGGYSYTKGTGTGAEGFYPSWQAAFASRLNEWRKARP